MKNNIGSLLTVPNKSTIVKTAKKVFNINAMTPNHTVVRNDLIKIFALAVLLLLVMAVLYWYDQRTEVFGEWSQKFYQFILRR